MASQNGREVDPRIVREFFQCLAQQRRVAGGAEHGEQAGRITVIFLEIGLHLFRSQFRRLTLEQPQHQIGGLRVIRRRRDDRCRRVQGRSRQAGQRLDSGLGNQLREPLILGGQPG